MSRGQNHLLHACTTPHPRGQISHACLVLTTEIQKSSEKVQKMKPFSTGRVLTLLHQAEMSDPLAPRRRSGERDRERGIHKEI